MAAASDGPLKWSDRSTWKSQAFGGNGNSMPRWEPFICWSVDLRSPSMLGCPPVVPKPPKSLRPPPRASGRPRALDPQWRGHLQATLEERGADEPDGPSRSRLRSTANSRSLDVDEQAAAGAGAQAGMPATGSLQSMRGAARATFAIPF